MQNLEQFYTEVQRVFCPKFKKMGHNLSAFNDVLRGGFGEFELGETIEVEFVHSKKAKQNLGTGIFKSIIKILQSHPHIQLFVDTKVKSGYY